MEWQKLALIIIKIIINVILVVVLYQKSSSVNDVVNTEVIQHVALQNISSVHHHPGGTASNSTELVDDKAKHWEFQLSESDDRIECYIYTKLPHTTQTPTLSSAPSEEHTIEFGNHKEQYVIHIHGLHHTGTGYLRQTLFDGLNEEFSNDAASIQKSRRPYQHLFDKAEKNRTKLQELYRQYKQFPEDEGQHLQTVYPRYINRVELLRNTTQPSIRKEIEHKIAYMADTCTIINNDDDNIDHNTLFNSDDDDIRILNNKNIGNSLMKEWYPYWDSSARFLLQKSPSLDVHFLETTKVLPTLHVIIVRHPLTSNSYGQTRMGEFWLSAYQHVFELVEQEKIEWYAILTYEALISYHDQVLDELMEVVHSGMKRYQTSGRNLKRNHATYYDRDTERSGLQRRRRLPYHKGNSSSTLSYLTPNQMSSELWEKCYSKPLCRNQTDRLIKDIFLPYLGYEYVDHPNVHELLPSANAVTVKKGFGHVLFSSEGDSLYDKFSKARENDNTTSNKIGYKPPSELISMMKKLTEGR